MEDVTKLKISNVEKERLLIKNLNNRPNAMATYGQAKMSSTEAKDIFDKQFEFLTERFNNMADSVAAVDNKLDEFMSDVSSAFDEIHEYAEGIIGGAR
jgi:methyl-accepting chemotaxis protein